MNRFLRYIIFLSALAWLSCSNQFVIDRGIVKDSPTLRLTNRNVALEPDKFFTLSQLGLEANVNVPSMRQSPLMLYTKQGIGSYVFEVDYKNKKYQGRIAFFQALEPARSQPVTNYYKITIPDKYFEDATDGRTSCVYEYYTYGGDRFATWVVWLSDVPLTVGK